MPDRLRQVLLPAGDARARRSAQEFGPGAGGQLLVVRGALQRAASGWHARVHRQATGVLRRHVHRLLLRGLRKLPQVPRAGQHLRGREHSAAADRFGHQGVGRSRRRAARLAHVRAQVAGRRHARVQGASAGRHVSDEHDAVRARALRIDLHRSALVSGR